MKIYRLLAMIALVVLVCAEAIPQSIDIPVGQSVQMGNAPSDFSSLRNKNLLLRRDQNAFRLQTPILYEDLEPGAGSPVPGVGRQEVAYQVGIINGLPLFIRIDVPEAGTIPQGESFVTTVEPAVERLVAALAVKSSVDIQQCAAGKVCTKTCRMRCCEWKCK